MTRPRRFRVWRESQMRELLRADRPPDPCDLVVDDDGRIANGQLECRWLVSVEKYLASMRNDK